MVELTEIQRNILENRQKDEQRAKDVAEEVQRLRKLRGEDPADQAAVEQYFTEHPDA